MSIDPTVPAFIGITPLSKCLGVPPATLRRWSNNGVMPTPIRLAGAQGQRYWKIELLKTWIATMEKLPENMQSEVWEGIAGQSAPLPKKTKTHKQEKGTTD